MWDLEVCEESSGKIVPFVACTTPFNLSLTAFVATRSAMWRIDSAGSINNYQSFATIVAKNTKYSMSKITTMNMDVPK